MREEGEGTNKGDKEEMERGEGREGRKKENRVSGRRERDR